MSFAAHSRAFHYKVVGYHRYGFQYVGYVAAHYYGGYVVVRKLAVNYFNSVLRHALDCPVFGVLHSVVSFKYHITVVDRGYHILELVCSALKKSVCHSRVRFARMVLPSAVAGRLCAELACAYQVAYSRYEYSVLYYLRVVGEYSVVVKEIACYRQRGACSVAHIAYGGGYLSVHIAFCKRAVLYEHIHLHSVTESLVREQSRYRRVGYNVVNAGDYGLCGNQLLCFVYKLIHFLWHTRKHLAEQVRAFSLARSYHFIALAVVDKHNTVYPGVCLLERAVFAYKYLVYVKRAQNCRGV